MKRRHSLAYRHWLEYPMLIFTIAVLTTAPAIVILLLAVGDGPIAFEITLEDEQDLVKAVFALALIVAFFLFILIGLGLLALWTARRKLNRLRRGAVRVSATQFPEIYHLAQQTWTRLDIRVPVEIHLVDTAKMQRPMAPISVLGFTKPYFIVLATSLVAEMSPGELGYLLGVQYGHVKLGHVRMLTIIDSVSGGLGHIPFIGGFVRFTFTGWTRLAVFSADRAGLIGAQRIEDAYGALVKLTIDARHFDQLNHEALAMQAKRTRGGFAAFFGRTTMPFDTQPLGRFDRLVPFAASSQFSDLCPDADLSFAYLHCWL